MIVSVSQNCILKNGVLLIRRPESDRAIKVPRCALFGFSGCADDINPFWTESVGNLLCSYFVGFYHVIIVSCRSLRIRMPGKIVRLSYCPASVTVRIL